MSRPHERRRKHDLDPDNNLQNTDPGPPECHKPLRTVINGDMHGCRPIMSTTVLKVMHMRYPGSQALILKFITVLRLLTFRGAEGGL